MTEIEYWTQQIAKGRISRREFMGRAAVLGLGTALATTLLEKAGIAAEPKRGGSARFGMPDGSTTDTMDPGTWPATFTECAFFGAMGSNLTEVDAKGDMVGTLAEHMESSDGAKKWVFNIRKGVTFHNGKSVTATDVVETFRYHIAPNSKSAAKPLLASVVDIKADGQQTVVFTLDSGSADFPYIVSDYHFPIWPAKGGGGIDWASGIGCGPFSLESFQPGVSAKLKRNPNYYKEGKPYFNEVEFLALTDVTSRTNALLTGAVDYIASCDLKTLHLLKANPNITVLDLPSIAYYTFAMNIKKAPFDNNDVRLALKYAIDRDEILKKILLGHGTVGNDNPIAKSIKYAIDPKPVYSYDPEKARFHVKKAGLSTLKVDLSVADAAFPGAIDAGVLYKAQAAKAGIDINVVREPNDGYWDNVWQHKPWAACYWNGRATCDWMFSTAFTPNAAWNDTKWDNPRFTQLMVAARAETDDKKRAAMYAEMQQLVHDQSGDVVLAFNNYVNAHSKKIAHGQVGHLWDDDGNKIAERWWSA